MIEHNLDVIKCADWVIDMEPEGGSGGGQVVATGTPEQIAKVKASYTGKWLRDGVEGQGEQEEQGIRSRCGEESSIAGGLDDGNGSCGGAAAAARDAAASMSRRLWMLPRNPFATPRLIWSSKIMWRQRRS